MEGCERSSGEMGGALMNWHVTQFPRRIKKITQTCVKGPKQNLGYVLMEEKKSVLHIISCLKKITDLMHQKISPISLKYMLKWTPNVTQTYCQRPYVLEGTIGDVRRDDDTRKGFSCDSDFRCLAYITLLLSSSLFSCNWTHSVLAGKI